MIWTWTDADLVRLEQFLRGRGLVDGPLTARPIGDGHANLTFLVTDGVHEVVVRRPPPPPTPPGANDVLREARVITALAGTAVPVPEVLAVALAGEVLDVPCYVMPYLRGVVITDASPPSLSSPDERRAIAEAMIDTLVELHRIDWKDVGIHGRPEGFNARHLQRMGQLVADDDGRPPPRFRPIVEWLSANVPPESGASVVHSDFRLGNVMFDLEAPARLLAVLDWELSAVGDPLLDLGHLLAAYPQAGEPLTPMEELGLAMLEPGFPTRAVLAERYAQKSGRDVSNLNWYQALALWKVAVLYEYSYRRAVAGVGDPYFADPALVARFLDAGEWIARGRR